VSVDIRPGTLDDLERLTEIYNHYVRESQATFDVEQFTPQQRRTWFDHYSGSGRHRLFVADDGGALLGYATTSPLREKPAYETSVESTIYLVPEATGRGVGTQLYAALLAAMEGEDVHRAYAGIAMPNDASVALHERFGFRQVGYFSEQGRKLGRYWDVAWYEKEL
jgi:phosphinothricin acetyltransferase